jgi:hypothetical protein
MNWLVKGKSIVGLPVPDCRQAGDTVPIATGIIFLSAVPPGQIIINGWNPH